MAPRHPDQTAPAPSCDSLVFLGNVDWWYHNRGHSSVRIATRLARGLPTLWVNSIGMRMPVPGRTDIAGRRYSRKLKSLLKGLRRDPDSGMWIFSPLFWPRYTRRATRLNGRLVAIQLRLVRRLLHMRRPSAWVSLPTFAPVVERLPWHRVVFDRCDDFATLPEADRPLVQELEARLLRFADVTAYVHPPLYEREKTLCRQARFLGHGVDFDLFSAARPLGARPADVPPELSSLPRPLVGFYGGLDEYRMDVNLLLKLADHLAARGGTLALIGPEQMDLSALQARPNVRCLGQLPPDQLPRFAACFDVAVIPFLRNQFNLACSPVKLKEYLALGFPIVATSLPAYEPYRHLIHLADHHDAFLSSLDAAIAETGDPIAAGHRRQAVSADSWDRVADLAAEFLGADSGQPDANKPAPSPITTGHSPLR